MFAVAYHFAYVSYISPEYAYAGFIDMEPSALFMGLTYALIAAPVINFDSDWDAPAAYGAAMIYCFLYIPIQLLIVAMWERSEAEMIVAQLMLCASMTIILHASVLGRTEQGLSNDAGRSGGELGLGPAATIVIYGLTVVGVLVLVVFYGRSMRLVAPEDIYVQRFETGQINGGPLVNYSLSWLGYVCLPFYFARGIVHSRPGDIAIGVFVSLLSYAATANKGALLSGFLILGLHLLLSPPRAFLLRVIVAFGLLTTVLALIPSDDPDDPIRAIKFLFWVRMLGLGGWEAVKYYDFFATHGFTYYSHIGPINALTGDYSYGSLSLGQVIGLQVAGTEEANFNASFWPTDAFAALGLAGVPVVTVAICGLWYIINRTMSSISSRFTVLWLAGFWGALLNIPLTAALLSGGGLIVISLVVLNTYLRKDYPPDTASDSLEREFAA